MGRQANHRNKWMHNRNFLSKIPREACDWTVTVAFYTALHAAEVLFAFDKAKEHASHSERDSTLAYSRYDPIRTSYLVLKNASRIARYDCMPNVCLRVEDVRDTLIRKHLWKIEEYVRSEVDPDGKHINIKPVEWLPDTPSE